MQIPRFCSLQAQDYKAKQMHIIFQLINIHQQQMKERQLQFREPIKPIIQPLQKNNKDTEPAQLIIDSADHSDQAPP